jgi:hypothetical protein
MTDARKKPIILPICDCHLTTHNFSSEEGNIINSTKMSFTSMNFPYCDNTLSGPENFSPHRQLPNYI